MQLKNLSEQAGNNLKLNYIELDVIQDYFLERNSKKHDRGKIIDSIQRYGFKKPLAFDPNLNNGEGGILFGNGRIEALVEMRKTDANVPNGIEEGWKVPVLFGVNAVNEAEAIAFSVEDNLSSTWGSEITVAQVLTMFDTEDLSAQFRLLDEANSLPLSFADDLPTYRKLLDDSEDLTPEREKKEIVGNNNGNGLKNSQGQPRIAVNQVWQLGRHFLACIDSTDKNKVDAFLGERKIELLFTSPPYAGMQDYTKESDLSLDKVSDFIPAWCDHVNYQVVNLGLQFKDSAVVPYWDIYLKKAESKGLKLLAWNIWDKMSAGSISHQTNMFTLTHEWIFVFGKERKKLNRTIPNKMKELERRYGMIKEELLANGAPSGIREQTGHVTERVTPIYTHHQLHSVVQQTVECGSIREKHPATFPVALPVEYIKAFTTEEDAIADCFAGSGSTLMAAEQINRTCLACEISPEYCTVIMDRFEELTGIEPKYIRAL